jgi:hypothetical protein
MKIIGFITFHSWDSGKDFIKIEIRIWLAWTIKSFAYLWLHVSN